MSEVVQVTVAEEQKVSESINSLQKLTVNGHVHKYSNGLKMML